MHVHVWSVSYPEYEERMFAMNQQESVQAAFIMAGELALVPKE